jgi:phage-related protein (TIGR01555 family)
MASFRQHLAAGLRAALQGPPPAATPPPAARADTLGAISPTSAAALINPISGIGSADDSGAASRPNLSRERLSMDELVALLRGSLYRRICDVIPSDAMRRGLIVTDDTRRSNPLQVELEQFDVAATLRRAATLGRALGTAWIWPVVEDGGAPLSEPLDMQRVTRLYALHVLDPRDLTVWTWSRNLREPGAGQPLLYTLQPCRPELYVPPNTLIHRSRLIAFWGDELPPSEQLYGNESPLGDAIGQTMWDGLRNLTQTSAAGARLAEELSIAVFYLAKMPEKDAAGGRDLLRTALNNIMRYKSIAHGLVLGTGDKAERLGANASGFDTLTEAGWEVLQSLSGVPAARLRGVAPSGLSTDGASWQQSYYSDVDAWASERLQPAARQIVRLLYRHRGQEPASWHVGFGPFYHLSMQEQAQLRLLTAQHDQLAEQAGWVTGEQIRRSRYGDGGWSFEIQPATDGDEARLTGAVDPEEAEKTLADLTGAPPDPLTAEQVKLVQEVLGNVSAGKVTTEVGRLLLEGVVGATRAAALIGAQGAATTVDAPDLTAQRTLAASMTAHGVERCEHGAVNRCRICGIERDRALVLGADGQPTRDAEGRPVWAVRWRALGDPDPTPDATTTEPRQDADFGGKALLSLTLGETGRAAWAELARRATDITGPLEGYEVGENGIAEPPHVTVLYLGAVADEHLAEIERRATAVVADFGPIALRASRIGTLPPGPASEGRVPVVAEIRAWELPELNDRLLRALAPFVTADQFARFRPHVTLGFATNPTPEQVAALTEILPDTGPTDMMSLGSVAALDLHHGNRVVARLPLRGTRADADAAEP